MKSICIKKQKLRANIRNKEKENYFEQVRTKILNAIQERRKREEISQYQSGQEQILQAIAQYEKNNQKDVINFDKVCQYVAEFQGSFRFQFVNEVTRTILNNFRQDEAALSTLYFLAQRTNLIERLTNIDLKRHFMQLIQQNTEHPDNGQTVCLIICTLLEKWQDKLFFDFLPGYYQIMRETLGFFNQKLLKCMSLASQYTAALLPKPKIIQAILIQQIHPQRIKQTSLLLICHIFNSYLLTYEDVQFYDQFIEWISQRLQGNHYSHNLRKKALKLLSIIIEKESTSLEDVQALSQNKNLMKSIVEMAVYEEESCKQQSLFFLCSLLYRISFSYLDKFLSQHGILQMVEKQLSQSYLDIQDTFRMLCLLAQIFQCNPRYIVEAEKSGLISQIYPYCNSQSVKIEQMSIAILDIYNEYCEQHCI